jgi:hypothetical protein
MLPVYAKPGTGTNADLRWTVGEADVASALTSATNATPSSVRSAVVLRSELMSTAGRRFRHRLP